ncbi:ATP-binding protein [Coprobacillaceae bacterium CR2/5/TPMF4]|nr:ATP-binding protein [Coprobacillaceae bacterium CR2/5/TPMF4]
MNTYPEINSKVYLADGKALSVIMNSLENEIISDKRLTIGKYASNQDVQAILDGNKFFQRHATIVGSTGSGKSFTVANILEKANELDHANLIVFDLHGEYNELSYAKQIKISDCDNGLHIPLWFFNYEEIHSLFIESSEGTSTNQRAAVIKYILEQKKKYITDNMYDLSSEIITADTPIPFSAKK